VTMDHAGRGDTRTVGHCDILAEEEVGDSSIKRGGRGDHRVFWWPEPCESRDNRGRVGGVFTMGVPRCHNRETAQLSCILT
jgi:hypothetical protein